jgi:5-methylcytosine-specific restriction endonuclease McrA
MMQEMEDARTNPAKVEEKRNREVWPYPQLPVKYEEYLESDFWRHIRKRVIRLADCDGEGCGKCSISQHECRERYGKGYQVHHKTYTRLGNEHPDDLVALCPACHAKEHGLPEPARKS